MRAKRAASSTSFDAEVIRARTAPDQVDVSITLSDGNLSDRVEPVVTWISDSVRAATRGRGTGTALRGLRLITRAWSRTGAPLITEHVDEESGVVVRLGPRILLAGSNRMSTSAATGEGVASVVVEAGMSGSCVCAWVGGIGGKRLRVPAGWFPDEFPFVERGTSSYALGVGMPVSNWVAWFGGWEAVRVEIPEAVTMSSDETEIVLQVGERQNPNEKWAKEVAAWSACRGVTKTVTNPGGGPRWMATGPAIVTGHSPHGPIKHTQGEWVWPTVSLRLTRATCREGDADTIVLRKPGAFGFWYDAAHWAPEHFWRLHGGRRVKYVWLSGWSAPSVLSFFKKPIEA
jgi:hypothetical protein